MQKINENISEFIGMHVGDGTLYKTQYGKVWELRGSLDEKEYYIQSVSQLLEGIFDIKFKPKFRSGGKNGCFGIQTSKKILTNTLIELGFKTGRKTHTVSIPDYIKKANNKIKFGFIRGYFDTDGCLRFDGKKIKNYPKIEFCSVSKNLRDDLFSMLEELSFKGYTWGKKEFKICLAGKENLEKFMKYVRPKNKKHLNKYFRWKGYAGMAQSGTAQSYF